MNENNQCPRCGTWSVENLNSHSHCWECNFTPIDHSRDYLKWLKIEFPKLFKFGSSRDDYDDSYFKIFDHYNRGPI